MSAPKRQLKPINPPERGDPPLSESELLALTREKIQPFCARLIRINGGVFRGAGGIPIKTYRLYGKGNTALIDEVLPDLFGFLPDGRPIAIEVKAKDRHKTAVTREREAKQGSFLGVVRSVGGIGEMIESAEELGRLVEKIKTALSTEPGRFPL